MGTVDGGYRGKLSHPLDENSVSFTPGKRIPLGGQKPAGSKKVNSLGPRVALRNITNNVSAQSPTSGKAPKSQPPKPGSAANAAIPVVGAVQKKSAKSSFSIKARALVYAEDGIECVHQDGHSIEALLKSRESSDIVTRAQVALSFRTDLPTFLHSEVEVPSQLSMVPISQSLPDVLDDPLAADLRDQSQEYSDLLGNDFDMTEEHYLSDCLPCIGEDDQWQHLLDSF